MQQRLTPRTRIRATRATSEAIQLIAAMLKAEGSIDHATTSEALTWLVTQELERRTQKEH
jgi:hypothetical protein